MKKLFHFKNIYLLLVVLNSQYSFGVSNDTHLRIFEELEKVFTVDKRMLSLTQVKNVAISENINLKMAYESLYQAQMEISKARSKYFPYGLGNLAQMYFNKVWGPLIVLELVTSIPSKYFEIKKHKYLRNVQKYNQLALEENIRNEMAKLYINSVKDKSMLDIAGIELRLRENLYEVSLEKYNLGLISYEDLIDVKTNALNLRKEYLKYKDFWQEQQEAVDNFLFKTQTDSKQYKFAPIRNVQTFDKINIDINTLVKNVVEKSFEVKASENTVYAAMYAKKSKQWSVLSFNGLGLSYFGEVSIARSKVKEMIYLKEQTKLNAKDNVYLNDKKLYKNSNYLEKNKDLYMLSKEFVEGQILAFKDNYTSIEELINSEILLLKDYREYVSSHYDTLYSVENMKRIIFGKVRNNKVSQKDIEVVFEKGGDTQRLFLFKNNNLKVEYVNYEFSSVKFEEKLVTTPENNFLLEIQTDEPVSGIAKIALNDGTIIERKF